jgi:hypothetical protein
MIAIVHPFADHGRFAGIEPDALFVRPGICFGETRVQEIERQNGLTMHFAGWSRPLQAYGRALIEERPGWR